MTATLAHTSLRVGFGILLLAASMLMPMAPLAQQPPVQPDHGPAAMLRAKLRLLQPELERNAFQRSLALESSEAADRVSGDLHALVDHRFSQVSNALSEPAAWCQILMLHLNTKHCAMKDGRTLTVAIGRRYDQPWADAQKFDFVFGMGPADANYLSVRLSADTGPFSTRDYSIVLEAVPADGGKTAIRLTCTYGYGTAARLAMKGYLATLGRGKVGFTPQEQGGYIGGVRGVVERNTMRYYLAVDSYLDAPGPEQLESRLSAWFDATEQYPRQLREIEKSDYLAMKRHEFERMQPAVR